MKRWIKGLSLNAALDVKTRTVLCVVLCLPWLAPSYADTLFQVYEKAKQRDAVLQAARFSLQAAQEKPAQAQATLLPTVALTASQQQARNEVTFGQLPPEQRPADTHNWNLQLSQPLYRPQNLANWRQSEQFLALAKIQFQQAEQDLMLRTAQAYFETLIADETLAATQAQLKATDQQWRQAQRAFTLGAGVVTDVSEAKARFDLAQAQQLAAQQDLEIKRAGLEKLTNEPVTHLTKLMPEIALPAGLSNDLTALINQAKENNLAVQLQRYAVAIAEQEVEKNRAAHAPTLDLVAATGKSFSSSSTNTLVDYESRNKSTQVGVQLNLPIYSGGGVNSRVREALANVGKVQAEWDNAQREAVLQARQAWIGVTGGVAQVQALQAALQSSQMAIQANQKGYQAGLRIPLDILNAEQQYYSVVRDLVKARYEVLLQQLKLRAVTGELSEQDFQALENLFAASDSN